ncbi:MAG: hypothetical protein MJ237_04570 [bacterium]|nr:hypothetical protein [bacterium]
MQVLPIRNMAYSYGYVQKSKTVQHEEESSISPSFKAKKVIASGIKTGTRKSVEAQSLINNFIEIIQRHKEPVMNQKSAEQLVAYYQDLINTKANLDKYLKNSQHDSSYSTILNKSVICAEIIDELENRIPSEVIGEAHCYIELVKPIKTETKEQSRILYTDFSKEEQDTMFNKTISIADNLMYLKKVFGIHNQEIYDLESDIKDERDLLKFVINLRKINPAVIQKMIESGRTPQTKAEMQNYLLKNVNL